MHLRFLGNWGAFTRGTPTEEEMGFGAVNQAQKPSYTRKMPTGKTEFGVSGA